jgi:hypothetical protein
MQVAIFCFVTPCSVAVRYRRFGGPWCVTTQKTPTWIFTAVRIKNVSSDDILPLSATRQLGPPPAAPAGQSGVMMDIPYCGHFLRIWPKSPVPFRSTNAWNVTEPLLLWIHVGNWAPQQAVQPIASGTCWSLLARRRTPRYEVFGAVKIQVEFFWLWLCSDVVRYRRFGVPFCLHLQADVYRFIHSLQAGKLK